MTRTLAAVLLIAATSTASLPLAAGLMVAGLICATVDKLRATRPELYNFKITSSGYGFD